MPFAITWMDLEDIMLSEMSDRERQILYDISDTWNLKTSVIEAESVMVVARAWEVGEMRCWTKDMKFELCRMNKFWKSNVRPGDYC